MKKSSVLGENEFSPLASSNAVLVPVSQGTEVTQVTEYNVLDENRETCDCPIDYQVNCTVKAQESMKGIIKIVHLPTMVQSELYEAKRIALYAKKIKITTLFNKLSPLRYSSAFLENIRWTQTSYAVLCYLRHTDVLFSMFI